MTDLNNTPNEELNNNVDLVPEDTTPADVTVVPDEQPEHKVLFGIVVGIACLTVVGIPVLIWMNFRQRKKLRQYEEQFGKLPESKEDKKDDAKAPAEGEKKESETK